MSIINKMYVATMNLIGLDVSHKAVAAKPKVFFYHDAAYHGDHGTIFVSSRGRGLVDVPVKFVFAGLSNPPKLDLQTMQYIWEQALEQGFVPQHIVTYKGSMELTRLEIVKEAA